MNFAYWLNLRDNLLMTADTEAGKELFIERVARFHHQVGLMSDAFPLLGNLTAMENIALMRSYHANISMARAGEQVLPDARVLDMEDCLDLADRHLTREQRLKTAFLRCLAKENIIVLLPDPRISDVEITLDSLYKTKNRMRLWILCLNKDEALYGRFGLRRINVDA